MRSAWAISAVEASAAELGPYKGPASYEVRDALLFRGRERASRELTALVLSSRLTLLHAASGAGKTSLLNARVLPDLSRLDWLPVRVRPGFNPVEAVKSETLKAAIPCPAVEARALERAREALALPSEAKLEELVARYGELPVADDRKRTLLEPVPSPVRGFGPVVPFVCGWLQGHLGDAALGRHMAAVLEGHGPRLADGSTTIVGAIEGLSSESAADLYHTLLAKLNVPAIPLPAFFENLTAVYEQRLPELCLVLVLDQFEEMFTRFVDPGPPPADAPPEVLKRRREQPDWQLRDRFFEDLRELYLGEGAEILPIRYLVSMRDDYVAKLDIVKSFVTDLDRSTYHLTMLDLDEAAQAISEPADEYGYKYSKELFERILQELTRERRFIEPAHLQMVCEKLWHESGRQLSRSAGSPEMDLTELERLRGTQGIFDSVLSDFLEKELDDEDERQEAAALLEPLITLSYTRNIVERDSLVRAPFQREALRRRILAKLEEARLVRVEARYEGYFLEITHEFLIPAILERIRALRSDPLYAVRSLALRSLLRFEEESLAGRTSEILSERELDALHKGWHRFDWPAWSAEAMLRAAIALGAGAEVVRFWADRYESDRKAPSLDDLRRRIAWVIGRDWTLDLDELRRLWIIEQQARDSAEGGVRWKEPEIDLILRSILTWADDSRAGEVVYWTLRHGETHA